MVYAILLYEELVTEDEYNKRRDELFLSTPEDDDLLYLEWETLEQFGRILMSKLKAVYVKCSDIKHFAGHSHSLWESLPGNIQNIEPFWALNYADDPLSWGDEEQARNIYEHMLNYYEN